jgi:hypothetical protein
LIGAGSGQCGLIAAPKESWRARGSGDRAANKSREQCLRDESKQQNDNDPDGSACQPRQNLIPFSHDSDCRAWRL